MQVWIMYVVAVLVVGWGAYRVARRGKLKRWWIFAYLALTSSSIIGFTTLAAIYLRLDFVPAALAGSTAITLLLLFLIPPAPQAQWQIRWWWVWLPLFSALGITALVIRLHKVLPLFQVYSFRNSFLFVTVFSLAMIGLLVGWPAIFSYLLAPAVALVTKRSRLKNLALPLLLAAHRWTAMPRLDVRQEALELYLSRGRHVKAARLAQKLGKLDLALSQFQAAGDLESEAAVLVELGRHREAAAKYEKLGDKLKAAETYELAGDLEKAADLYLQANGEEGFIRVCQAGSMFSRLGAYYERKRRYEEAASAYEKGGEWEKAAGLYHRIGDHRQAGEAYLALGDYESAEREYQLAEDIPGFIRQLRVRGADSILHRMKTDLIADWAALQRLDSKKDASRLRTAFPKLLERVELLSLENPVESKLARDMIWGAVIFFENQGFCDSIDEVHKALCLLKELDSKGLSLPHMERLAVLGRLMVLTTARGNDGDVETAVHEFLQALVPVTSEDWPSLPESHRRFLQVVVDQTVRILRQRGHTQLARELAGSLPT